MALRVRELAIQEGLAIQRILRRSQNAIQVRRAMVVLSSVQGEHVPVIARQTFLSEPYVRELIHRFNEEGLRSLNPRYNGPKQRSGESRTFAEEEKAAIVQLAQMPPQIVGYPFTRWSLSKLRGALLRKGIVSEISEEALRQILHSEGVTFQRTRTWKVSRDPEFERKRKRIERVKRNHARHPGQGTVVSVDEFGPLALRPELGANWAREGRPDRVPATYRRGEGGQHLLAALDLTHDKLYGWAIPRKRWWRLLRFLKYLRRKFPRGRLWVILDNHSTHEHREVKRWAKENRVSLVYTPTNASWLDPIECHFAPMKEFALRNVYYRDHREQARALRRYIAWRNAHPDDPELLTIQNRNNVG